MVFQKLQKSLAIAVAASLMATSVPSVNYTQVFAEDKQSTKSANTEAVSLDDEGVFKVTMDDTGYITADDDYAANVDTPFSWDNANVYFVLTDRFNNGDTKNDHSYGRSATSSTVPAEYKDTFETVAGSYAKDGEKNASGYESRVGTFHGGDLKGMTQKLEEGYFDELGTNAIWISAPYEQVHGAMTGNGFKHYAYHGYYALDYTNVDANMGTAEDLKEFVTTAHEHGIRVIFDVVMNHCGYADPYTIAEYYGTDAGVLNSSWRDVYYGTDEGSYKWYMDYSEYGQSGGKGSFKSAGWTDIFWTNSWIRNVEKNDDGSSRFAGCGGAESGSDTELCSGGLPDFKTESASEVGIPSILQKKWTKEGVLSEKQSQIDSMFQRTGLQKNVTGYLVGWLSEWVKDYGIDGFRCDTAKHVGKSEWKKLYTACNAALKQWRTDNPNEPGAQWNDEFWMTGECWGWSGLAADSYFTEGGFTSMINFGYQGSESAVGSALDGTFSKYANAINGKDNFNVLSYISSHDKGLGARSASAGTALLLNPGGVQTFYGDESGRQAGSGADYEPARSHMNWSSTNESILSNWQKVGRFRRNHIAVGAGQHKKLADSPYTFSRTYTGKATVGSETKTDYEDKVVVCLPGKAGTYDVSVGDVFEDGETVKDEYSGAEYTVSGGQVSAECDKNGVILLAGTGVSKPSVGASPGSKSYTTDTLTIKLSASQTESAYYTIDGGEQISFKNGDTIEIGENCEIGDSTTIVVGGVGEDGTKIAEKTFTFKKEKEPDYTFYLRVPKTSFKTAPNVYVYEDVTETAYSSIWPGDKMEVEGDYYVYKSKEYSEARVIFSSNDDAWRYPEDMQPGVLVSGYMEYEKDGDVKAFTPTQSGTTTKAPTKTTAPVATKTTAPTKTPAATKTTAPTKTPAVTKTTTPTKTTAPPSTDVDSSTDKDKTTPTPSSGSNTSGTSEEALAVGGFLISKASPQTLGQTIVLAIMGKGGSGNYTYRFVVEDAQTGIVTYERKYSKEFIANWTPKKAGTYKIRAYVKDLHDGSIEPAIQNYQIVKKLTVSKVSVKRVAKLRYKVSVSAKGNNPLKYKFVTVSATGKKSTVQNYSKSKTRAIKFKSKGKYIVYVYVKDGSGAVKKVKKTVNVK